MEIENLEFDARCASYYLHNHGLFVESMIVEELLKQRAELLVALKDMYAAASGGVKSCGHDFHCTCPYDQALSTITKCEAAK